MASSSASSITNSSSFSKSSRFSTTLKVFKFASKEAKSPPPPPPPPKDDFYSRNRSLVSLSPDSLSVPTTPLSPHPQHPYPYFLSPEMNQSAMSVASTAASATSYATADASSHKAPKKTKSGFFKFPKRSPRAQSTKSPPPDDPPPAPAPDTGIGVPFNFQHNIHVDEGLMGLPPSWTMSLAQAGFSEEEIAELHARRAAGRSHFLFTDRPASPAYTATEPVIITYPSPRTASLSRQASDASREGTTETSPRSPHSPAPSRLGSIHSSRSPTRTAPPRRPSVDEISNPHHPPSISSRSRSGSVNTHLSDGQSTSTATSPTSPLSRSIRPITPPRRNYHVTNDAMHSPPPSYTNFTPNGKTVAYPSDTKDASLFDSSLTRQTHKPSSSVSNSTSLKSPDTTPQATRIERANSPRVDTGSLHERTPSSSSSSEATSSPILGTRTESPKKRLTALPPRLSLHKATDSTDLSLWGQSLLSGISSGSDGTPNSSKFAGGRGSRSASTSAGSEKSFSIAANKPESAGASAASPPRAGTNEPLKNGRAPAPSRPIPPLKEDAIRSAFYSDGEDDEIPSSSLAEPAMTARYDPLAENWDVPERSSPEYPEPLPVWGSSQGTHRVNRDTLRPGYVVQPGASLAPAFSPPSHKMGGSTSAEEGDDESLLRADQSPRRFTNRDSSRSSTSTVMAEPATIMRKVSIARRAGAYVIDNSKVKGGARPVDQGRERSESAASTQTAISVLSSIKDRKQPPSPLSLNFGSEEGSASTSGSSSTLSQDQQTPISDADLDSPLTYYLDSSPSPDPSKLTFPLSPTQLKMSVTDDLGIVKEEFILRPSEEDETPRPASPPPRPKIVISDVNESGPATAVTSTSNGTTPLTPFQRYPGWLSSVVAPLEQFIDEAIDPRDFYLDLHEIAEGESGSVFAARLTKTHRHKLKLLPSIEARDADDLANDRTTLVAIKSVAILPSGSPKLVDLERELSLMKGFAHEHVLSMDAVYVDLVEDTLWIRMELMERSLADIIGLVPEGLMLQDRMIARFASDVLLALEFLQKHCIAHRDVRSDNLLLNSQGILKLTDFSNAVRVPEDLPMLSDAAGVLYWQAPEVRSPPYNALQVDVWSLGATVWEMAEAEPPFAATQQISDRWPPLSKPQLYSPAFHDFLRLCSQSASSRPTPNELKKTPFINNACGRPVIIQLLSQCMAIEQVIQEREASQGSV